MSITEPDPYIFYTKSRDKDIRDSSGYLLRRYHNISKKIKFKHKAVNDYNQHLCGGWQLYPLKKFEELDRVAMGLKPLGVCYSNNLAEVKNKVKELSKNNLLVTYIKHPEINGEYIITASVKGKLKDYFDMNKLASDYEEHGISPGNIIKYKNMDFIKFHHDDKMDCNHPMEIIGLIFGYPIENTISWMKEIDHNVYFYKKTINGRPDPYVFYTLTGHKQIRGCDGNVWMTYPNVPKDINFKHMAVNDYNQHFCGSWDTNHGRESRLFEEVDRVVLGLKPVGISYSLDSDKIAKKIIELSNKGLLVTQHESLYCNKTLYGITVSVNGKLGDYFDMDTLAEDYERYGLTSKNIHKYKNVSFGEFHYDKFDTDVHPIEITGLILGYPIENTISLMLK